MCSSLRALGQQQHSVLKYYTRLAYPPKGRNYQPSGLRILVLSTSGTFNRKKYFEKLINRQGKKGFDIISKSFWGNETGNRKEAVVSRWLTTEYTFFLPHGTKHLLGRYDQHSCSHQHKMISALGKMDEMYDQNWEPQNINHIGLENFGTSWCYQWLWLFPRWILIP